MSTAPTFFFSADEHYGHAYIINSWQLYGHSHGKLAPIGKQWDIGVDNNNFYPVSFNKICEIMVDRPDNPNFVKNNAD